MKKVWSYIALFFIGLSSGIVVAVKWLNEKTVYKGNFKFKQRGQGNQQQSDIIIETGEESAKFKRKQARIIKRNEKRAKKATKRLNKIS